MNEEINKYLTEAMGEQWNSHIITHLGFSKYKCSCGGSWDNYALEEPEHCTKESIDLDTWDGFGKLFTWAKEQGWWYLFYSGVLCDQYVDDFGDRERYVFNKDYINPVVFATKIYNFLKEAE